MAEDVYLEITNQLDALGGGPSGPGGDLAAQLDALGSGSVIARHGGTVPVGTPGLRGLVGPLTNAASETWEMVQNLAKLTEMGIAQTSRLMPSGERMTDDPVGQMVIDQIQGSAKEYAHQIGEAVRNTPEEILKQYTALATDPVGYAYERPIEAITNTLLPFSLASGLARQGAKAASVVGATGATNKLLDVSETISPRGLRQAGGSALRSQVPALQKFHESRKTAAEAGRLVRSARRESVKMQLSEIDELGKKIDKLSDLEKDIFPRAVEGRLAPNTALSPAMLDAIRHYRGTVASDEARLAGRLTDTPLQYGESMHRFELAHFKPLAEQMGTTPEKLLMEFRLGGTVGGQRLDYLAGESPTYFPHYTEPIPKAAEAGLALSSPYPYFLRGRKGQDLPQDLPTTRQAIEIHRINLNNYMTKQEILLDLKDRWGVPIIDPLTGTELVGKGDVKGFLDGLAKRTGHQWVEFFPDVFLQDYKKILANQANVNNPVMLNAALQASLQRSQTLLTQMLEGEADIAQGVRRWALPKVVWERARDELRPLNKIPLIDTATEAWKHQVLAFSPRWLLGNVFGSMGLGFLAGANPVDMVASKIPGTRMNRIIGSLPEDVRIGMTFDVRIEHAMRQAEKVDLHTLPTGKWAHAIRESYPGRMYSKMVNVMYDVNQATDNFFRNVVAANHLERQSMDALMRQGHSFLNIDVDTLAKKASEIASDPTKIQATIDYVNHFMGNYDALHPIIERQYLRRVWTFWPWYKSMTKLLVDMPFSYPGRNEALLRLASVAAEADPEEQDRMPPYAKGLALAFKPGRALADWETDKTIPRTLRISARGLVPFGGAVESVIPSMNPVLSTLAQMTTGTTGFGQKIDPAGLIEANGSYWQVDPELYDRMVASGVPIDGDSLKDLSRQVTGTELAFRKALAAGGQVLPRQLPLINFIEAIVRGERPDPNTVPFIGDKSISLTPRVTDQTLPEYAIQALTGIRPFETHDAMALKTYVESQVEAFKKGYKQHRLQEIKENK